MRFSSSILFHDNFPRYFFSFAHVEFSFHLADRTGSLNLAGSDASISTTTSTARHRMLTNKLVDNRPKHLILGDFELTNVV